MFSLAQGERDAFVAMAGSLAYFSNLLQQLIPGIQVSSFPEKPPFYEADLFDGNFSPLAPTKAMND